jgi:hypothetical protein
MGGSGAGSMSSSTGSPARARAETTTGGWRIAERPGRYMRAALSMVSADLDAIEEVFSGYEGPLKLSLCGPWTLAATIELPCTLNPVLSVPGHGRRPNRAGGTIAEGWLTASSTFS